MRMKSSVNEGLKIVSPDKISQQNKTFCQITSLIVFNKLFCATLCCQKEQIQYQFYKLKIHKRSNKCTVTCQTYGLLLSMRKLCDLSFVDNSDRHNSLRQSFAIICGLRGKTVKQYKPQEKKHKWMIDTIIILYYLYLNLTV